MRANDIKHNYPNFHDAYEPRSTRAADPILTMDRHRVGQCVFRVTLQYVRTNFDGRPAMLEGLHAMDMQLIEGDFAACRGGMVADLQNRYGRHPETFKGDPRPPKGVSTSDYMGWWGPVTFVSITTTYVGLDRSLLDVSYSDAEYDDDFLRPES